MNNKKYVYLVIDSRGRSYVYPNKEELEKNLNTDGYISEIVSEIWKVSADSKMVEYTSKVVINE